MKGPDLTNRRTTMADDGGYAMVLCSLLLIPMLAIAAVGIDVGVWFLQAQRNQSIADAASLAGAVWLPDPAKAQANALEAVRMNGLRPGIDSTVKIERQGATSLRVSVSTKSALTFSQMLIDEFAITRASVAQFNPPVALGSPENQLGDPSLWLAVSGYCSVRENGDRRSARFVAGYPGGNYPPAPCSGYRNPDYDADGYLFSVFIPSDPGGPVTIEAYDAAYNPASTPDLEFRPPSAFDTSFSLYEPDASQFDLGSRPIIARTWVRALDPTYFETWRPVLTITDPQPGYHYIRVNTYGGTNSFGSNGFALRAVTGGAFTRCSTITDPDCIRISAPEDLPLYAALSNGSSTFYLTELDPSAAGKTLVVSLFDVGEGADSIEILDPNGQPASFTWETDCTVGIPLTTGCSGAGTSLDVSGTDDQIYADTLGSSRFNDRTVVLSIDLPDDYATAYAGNWWQVRYNFGSDITDRTTWSVTVAGDPVRLIG